MCVLNKTLLTFCSTNNLLIFSDFASYCQGSIYMFLRGDTPTLMGVNLRFGIIWGVLDRMFLFGPKQVSLMIMHKERESRRR